MRFSGLAAFMLGIGVLAALPAHAWKQQDFVWSFWWPPPPAETTPERYKQIDDAGFNLVLGGNGVANADNSAKMLDLSQQFQLRALVQDDRISGGKAEGVPAVVQSYGTHSALEGFLVMDEPGVSQFAALRDTVAALRKADGKRLAFINLLPTYATPQQMGAPTYEEYVQQYLDTVKPDVLSFDHYPFLTHGERPDYLENLEIIRRQALSHKVPFWAIVQSEGIEGAYRSPGETEMRSQVYTALAYGARGILFFTYWTPEAGGGEKHFDGILSKEGNARARYEWVKDLKHDLDKFLTIQMDLKSRAVYQVGVSPKGTKPLSRDDLIQDAEGGPATLGTFDGPKSMRYLWVVNRDPNESNTVTIHFYQNKVTKFFEIQPGGKISENLMRTDLKFPAAYEVRLGPGEGRLFQLPDARR